MKVSIFKDIMYYVCDSSTEEIINRIRQGEADQLIVPLRKLKAEGKEEEYGQAKKKLLSFTVSGTFRNGRKAGNLHEYNGNIVIDVDKLPPSLLQQCERIAKVHSYTYACFISPGGDGLKIIVRTVSTPETHKIIFLALKNYMEDLLNIFIDDSGSDIPRLCLYSSDPTAVFNPNSKIFNPTNLIP